MFYLSWVPTFVRIKKLYAKDFEPLPTQTSHISGDLKFNVDLELAPPVFTIEALRSLHGLFNGKSIASIMYFAIHIHLPLQRNCIYTNMLLAIFILHGT